MTYSAHVVRHHKPSKIKGMESAGATAGFIRTSLHGYDTDTSNETRAAPTHQEVRYKAFLQAEPEHLSEYSIQNFPVKGKK